MILQAALQAGEVQVARKAPDTAPKYSFESHSLPCSVPFIPSLSPAVATPGRALPAMLSPRLSEVLTNLSFSLEIKLFLFPC